MTGDRILSVTIGFDNIAYEDALTILSYAAPYPMTLKLVKGAGTSNHKSMSPTAEVALLNSKIYHPVYRSQSLGGGSHNAKKVRKMPSRPGTSLSQIDYGKLFIALSHTFFVHALRVETLQKIIYHIFCNSSKGVDLKY